MNYFETGPQLNTSAEYMFAAAGSKSVDTISSGEKGETVSVISCCNTEGVCLPLYCILKEKCKKERMCWRILNMYVRKVNLSMHISFQASCHTGLCIFTLANNRSRSLEWWKRNSGTKCSCSRSSTRLLRSSKKKIHKPESPKTKM